MFRSRALAAKQKPRLRGALRIKTHRRKRKLCQTKPRRSARNKLSNRLLDN